MKTSKRCPKCQGTRIGHFENQVDRSGEHDNSYDRAVGCVAQEGWVFTHWHRTGTLEAYVCADCGYFEDYVVGPEHMPWDKLIGFSWVNRPDGK